MVITSSFEGGNIEVISCEKNTDIRLQIRKDTQTDHFQWFYFRLTGAEGFPCTLTIENASQATYPEGWANYQAVASYDRENWFRVPTRYDEKSLIIEHTPSKNSIFYAYFAPYSYERHLDLVHIAQDSGIFVLDSLGKTVMGREIDYLVAGEPSKSKKNIWITARQHCGETMASWFMEGFIGRLLDEFDPVSRTLLENCVFHIVPHMNIDGAILGNLRCNARGKDLNREWANPSIENSPEVYYVLNRMMETGVDLNLDIHGDEGLPYNFISSIEGIPAFDQRLNNLLTLFKTYWKEINPDFQTEYGYPKNEPGKANLAICSKQVGQRFNCLSMTIEMPFKDNANMPDPIYGWSPERAFHMGESILQVILRIFHDL